MQKETQMNEEVELKTQSDNALEEVSGGTGPNGIAICRYCGKRVIKDKILIHIQVCSSNPNHKTLQEIQEEKANNQ